jgi:hypothetical protein
MCDYDSAEGTRLMINQDLYEAARRIEQRLAGERASDAAWDVFFGRAGGAVVWAQFCRIKTSYIQAAALAELSGAFRRKSAMGPMRCEIYE